MKRIKKTYKFGDCPGCHERGVKLHPTFDSPEPICFDCAWKIQRAVNWGANAEHIRREMRMMGIPTGLSNQGDSFFSMFSVANLWDDEEERKCRNENRNHRLA